MGTRKQNHSEAVIMDAKWNNVVDNVAVRIGLVVHGVSVAGCW